FSNETFYGGRLAVETMPLETDIGPAVVWIDVRGEFDRDRRGRSALNRPEATEVLEVLGELWDQLDSSRVSIGVVSPFRAHVDLMKQLIADRRRDLLDVVTVDTAHGFQGDERDVMVFSTVLTPTMPAGLVRHAGQSNLVNVSVTRARAKLVIVGDRRACLESKGSLAALARYSQAFDRS
ncbi:MAG: C-terminal helicase domain-containing protein, partial [Acidimicrobiales bacterium]